MKRILLTLTILAAFALPAAAADTATDIPVTKVVLFSSGVGYFEHNGTIEGNAAATLMFKADQMNDILKSMVVMDAEGGAASINYPSQDPLERALKSFAVDLSGDPTLADMLKQLRGAEVVVQAPEKITGKILSIESQQKQIVTAGAPVLITQTFVNLMTDAGIKALPVESIQSFTLTDEKLSGEITKALNLIIASHDTQRKPVEIRFAGKGKRPVRIGYIAQTPVWKTSYRLEFRKEGAKGKEKDGGFIQGWAIVENTSDSDWSGVGLSLVSGRPISFIQDLYTPLYLARPVVVPELYAFLRPIRYEEGMEKDYSGRTNVRGGGLEMSARSGRMPKSENMPTALAAAAPAVSFQLDGSVSMLAVQESSGAYDSRVSGDVSLAQNASVAAGGKIGELFQYTIKESSSIQRRRSAMLPIINAAIAAERVSIYNQSVLARHPLNGAYLTNTTGLKMLGGPVTVFDGGMYAGDAQIDNLGSDDKRLISYAVDLGMTVDPSQKTASRVQAGKIVRGVLQVSRLISYTQTYAILNKADAKRPLIIEHPFAAGRKLLEPEKYEEKTPALYRFRLAADKGKTDFTVREEQVQMQSIELLPCAPGDFLRYTKNAEISPKVKDALIKAAEMKGMLADLQRQLEEKTRQMATIKDGQERLRRNIDTAGNNTDLGRRYLAKLSAEEDQIEKLDTALVELRGQIEAQQTALADYLKNLTVE